jgi:hypothetical protein
MSNDTVSASAAGLAAHEQRPEHVYYGIHPQKLTGMYAFKIEGDYLGANFPDGCFAIFDESATFKTGDFVGVTWAKIPGDASFVIGKLGVETPQGHGVLVVVEQENFTPREFGICKELVLAIHKCIGVQIDLYAGKEGPRQ